MIKKSQCNNTEQSTSQLPSFLRNKIFVMFLLADLFLNYDSGVIPASLLEIVKEIDLGYKEQALLGSLVYLGLSFASLFTSPIFSKFGASKVCCYVLILNSLNCFLFSITNNKFYGRYRSFYCGIWTCVGKQLFTKG